MPDGCPLCQQPHTDPLQDQLCQLRLEIINLRLELRDKLTEERMLTQCQITKNWRVPTKTDPVNPTETVASPTDSANGV